MEVTEYDNYQREWNAWISTEKAIFQGLSQLAPDCYPGSREFIHNFNGREMGKITNAPMTEIEESDWYDQTFILPGLGITGSELLKFYNLPEKIFGEKIKTADGTWTVEKLAYNDCGLFFVCYPEEGAPKYIPEQLHDEWSF